MITVYVDDVDSSTLTLININCNCLNDFIQQQNKYTDNEDKNNNDITNILLNLLKI